MPSRARWLHSWLTRRLQRRLSSGLPRWLPRGLTSRAPRGLAPVHVDVWIVVHNDSNLRLTHAEGIGQTPSTRERKSGDFTPRVARIDSLVQVSARRDDVGESIRQHGDGMELYVLFGDGDIHFAPRGTTIQRLEHNAIQTCGHGREIPPWRWRSRHARERRLDSRVSGGKSSAAVDRVVDCATSAHDNHVATVGAVGTIC